MEPATWDGPSWSRRRTLYDEVAKAALFLLSDLSSGITGHILPIDGGYQIAGV